MRHLFDPRWRRLTILVVGLLATAGGIAYAAIPDGGNVYTGCMLRNVGTVRLIDPTLPASNLMSHCTSFEAQISWNQQGQKGETGAPGPAGKNGAAGANGMSPTVTQLSLGDSHCQAGGAAITDTAGTTAYVCSGINGQNGKDGQPFAGSFTSPNGLFSLTVADSGIELKGPNATLSLPQAPLLGIRVISTGQLFLHANYIDTEAMHDQTMYVANQFLETVDHDAFIHIKHDRSETVDNNQTFTVHGDRIETVDHSDGVTVGGNHSENVSGSYNVQASGTLNLRGSLVTINDGGTNCQRVARVGDLVSAAGVVLTGSASVCAGP